MSNFDDIVKSAQGGQLVDNLSERIGLASWQTEAALRALAPAISAALARAAATPESLRPVIAALDAPQHRAAFDNPDDAHSQASVDAGDAIVAHLFGSAAGAGEASQLAARESGLRADVLQRLLPVLLSIVAGGLSSTLAERGLGAALNREPAATPIAPAPQSAPEGAGGLAGALAGLFASLFGKPPAPAAPSASPEDGSREDVALEDALAQIRQIFATETPAPEGGRGDLDALLGRIWGPRRG